MALNQTARIALSDAPLDEQLIARVSTRLSIL